MRQAIGGQMPLSGLNGDVLSVKGPPYNGRPFRANPSEIFLFPDSEQYIGLTAGSRWALVGGKKFLLKRPVFVDGVGANNHIMLLEDMLKVFHERDLQRQEGHEIEGVQPR